MVGLLAARSYPRRALNGKEGLCLKSCKEGFRGKGCSSHEKDFGVTGRFTSPSAYELRASSTVIIKCRCRSHRSESIDATMSHLIVPAVGVNNRAYLVGSLL